MVEDRKYSYIQTSIYEKKRAEIIQMITLIETKLKQIEKGATEGEDDEI
jgi:hypothetical protein